MTGIVPGLSCVASATAKVRVFQTRKETALQLEGDEG